MKRLPAKAETILGAAALLALLAIVGYYQLNYALIADNATLLEFARRMAEGGKIVTDYADTNLPQSILLYVPAVWLGKLTSLPLYYAFSLYIYVLTSFSAFLCWRITLRLPFFSPPQAAFLAALFLMAHLYVSGIHIGQRDPVILLGLFPFILVQFCLNEGIKLTRPLAFAALIFGAAMMMVKPHYGLMPVLMMLWGWGARRSLLSLFRRADFLVLTAVTITTIAVNATFFRAYYLILFADILATYVNLKAPISSPYFTGACLYFAASLGASLYFLKGLPRKFCVTLAITGIALLIAYASQQKGLPYQLIPALILMFTHFFSLLLFYQPRISAPLLAAWTALALAVLFPVYPNYPRHSMGNTMPVAKLLQDCPKPCSFFITNEHNFMAFETALYTGSFFASRFSALWFATDFVCRLKKNPGDESALKQLEKYAPMLAEDLNRYKPDLVLLNIRDYPCPDGTMVTSVFPETLMQNAAFAKAWGQYEFVRKASINRREYFRDTNYDYDHMIEFQIYRRKNP